jgi:DNA-directed RNA polymerase subunit F
MPEDTKEQELIAALAENQGLLGEIKAQKAELNKIAGSVVDTLIKAGELDADKREKAIENLVTQPVKVAMCLKTTAEALIEKQQQKQAAPAAMGSGAEINKTAGVKTANQRSAADQAFLSKLGLV